MYTYNYTKHQATYHISFHMAQCMSSQVNKLETKKTYKNTTIQ